MNTKGAYLDALSLWPVDVVSLHLQGTDQTLWRRADEMAICI